MATPHPPKRTPQPRDPEKNKLDQEIRRTLITQLMAAGIYRPKLILAELKKKGHDLSRTQLWRDMAALDAEEQTDFREHRKRFRHVVFSRYLRRERDAERSIEDIQANEDANYKLMEKYHALRQTALELGEPIPKEPKLTFVDYKAKAALLRVSMDALEKASAIAGIATEIVGAEAGDLKSWGAVIRTDGIDTFHKRRARAFPEYERASKQRGARPVPTDA